MNNILTKSCNCPHTDGNFLTMKSKYILSGDGYILRSNALISDPSGFRLIPNGPGFSFAIHSCGDASIQLFQDFQETKAYEVCTKKFQLIPVILYCDWHSVI